MKRYLMAAVMAVATVSGPATAGPYLGKEFPDFTAVDAITGELISLNALRGKAVLVDFWATWCGPCRRELPNVKKVYEDYRDEGLVIVGISLDSSEAKFRTYVEKSGMNWLNVMEGGGWKTRLATKYGITSVPRAYVLDRNGVCVADRARGRNLEVAVRRALATVAHGAVDETDPVTNRFMQQLVTAHAAVRRSMPPLDDVSKRLAQLDASLNFDPAPGSERIAAALTRRVAMIRDTLIGLRGTLYRYGVVDQLIDPDLEIDPPDIAALRAAAQRMLVACESARSQLAWAGDGLVSLQRDVMAGTKSPETLDREISEMHDHAIQLAATWCNPG